MRGNDRWKELFTVSSLFLMALFSLFDQELFSGLVHASDDLVTKFNERYCCLDRCVFVVGKTDGVILVQRYENLSTGGCHERC